MQLEPRLYFVYTVVLPSRIIAYVVSLDQSKRTIPLLALTRGGIDAQEAWRGAVNFNSKEMI